MSNRREFLKVTFLSAGLAIGVSATAREPEIGSLQILTSKGSVWMPVTRSDVLSLPHDGFPKKLVMLWHAEEVVAVNGAVLHWEKFPQDHHLFSPIYMYPGDSIQWTIGLNDGGLRG